MTKYVVEGTQVVRDVIEADDIDTARRLFTFKYEPIGISSVMPLEEFQKRYDGSPIYPWIYMYPR